MKGFPFAKALEKGVSVKRKRRIGGNRKWEVCGRKGMCSKLTSSGVVCQNGGECTLRGSRIVNGAGGKNPANGWVGGEICGFVQRSIPWCLLGGMTGGQVLRNYRGKQNPQGVLLGKKDRQGGEKNKMPEVLSVHRI